MLERVKCGGGVGDGRYLGCDEMKQNGCSQSALDGTREAVKVLN